MIPAHKDAGSGRALVFLHGIGGNKESFDDQLDAFADRWHAISWDMPGYGDSALPPDMTWPVLADALAALLDHLDHKKAVIVGHSMGGMVAQEFVASHPNRVSALVLSGTSPAFGKPGGDWQQKFLDARLAPIERGLTPADIADELVAGMFGDDPDPAAMRRAAACMAQVGPETYRAALQCLVTFDRRDALAGIRCPTLVLAGEKDGNAPAAMMEKMAAKIPGARYHCMPGLGHLANFERPDVFNAVIADFLSDLGA